MSIALLTFAAALLVMLGWWTSTALRQQDRALQAIHDLAAHQKLAYLATLESNRLLALLVEHESAKKDARAKGVELLRERMKIRGLAK